MKRVDVQLDDDAVIRCGLHGDLAIQEGNECIVDCAGIMEHGYVVHGVEEAADAHAGEKLPIVLRRATLQDQAKEKENNLFSKIAKETCAKMILKLKLPMRLVSVRYSFDRALLKVLFAAEDRVDFRQLLKDLSAEVKTRIDIRQIGVRDEAKILGGMATCGRSLCCCQWLQNFESINVRMAKVQGLSLNPVAIGGMCGRLKCCLKYEYDHYLAGDRPACRTTMVPLPTEDGRDLEHLVKEGDEPEKGVR